MTNTAWGICRGQKRKIFAVRRQAASIAARARSFFINATVLQMSGSCNDELALQIRRRLLRFAPHHSSGVTACLVESGCGSGAARWVG